MKDYAIHVESNLTMNIMFCFIAKLIMIELRRIIILSTLYF